MYQIDKETVSDDHYPAS